MFTPLVLAVALLTIPSAHELTVASAVATTVAPIERHAAGAGARFAAELTQRFDAGWQVAAVDVIDDGSELSLEVVMTRAAHAEQLTVVFAGDGERPVAFERRAVVAPTERRIYRFAAELRAAVAGGAVESLFAECGAYFLEGAGGGASVDPYDYYVVVEQARGASARRLFAASIAGAIEDDMRVAGVIPSRGAVDVVLFKGHEEVVHAELDRRGRIAAVEVRWSPVAYASWARTYTGDAELGRALRAARVVEGLAFEAGAAGVEPRLILRLGEERQLVIDTADFDVDDEDLEDFDCPC